MSMNAATEESFKNLTRQMTKMRDQVQKGAFNFWPSETWTPAVNLYETDGSYLVCVDLAGVDKEKIDVVVNNHVLTLKGTRPVPTMEEGKVSEGTSRRIRVHLMEIDHGAFSREVDLPHNVVCEKITATYQNGMLWVELPKKN